MNLKSRLTISNIYTKAHELNTIIHHYEFCELGVGGLLNNSEVFDNSPSPSKA